MPSEYDRMLAALALRRGFASEEELQECGRQLKRRLERGEDLDLADLLLERRMVSEAQLDIIDRRLMARGVRVPSSHAEVLRRREEEAAKLGAAELGEIPDEAFGGALACKACGALIVEQSIGAGETGALCPRCRAERPRVGQVHMGYRIEKPLGEGRTGPLWKARDLTRRRDVAVKVHPERLARSAASLDAFLAAAGGVARTQRPRLINVLEAGRWGRGSFVVTEYVDGADLCAIMDEAASLPAERRLARLAPLLEGAVEAAAAVHDAGLTHGELRPRKFVVAPGGEVRLADGGIPLSRYFNVAPPEDAAYYVPDMGEAAVTMDGDLLALGRIMAEAVLGGRFGAMERELTKCLPRRTRAFVERVLGPDERRRTPTIPQLRREAARLRKLYA